MIQTSRSYRSVKFRDLVAYIFCYEVGDFAEHRDSGCTQLNLSIDNLEFWCFDIIMENHLQSRFLWLSESNFGELY